MSEIPSGGRDSLPPSGQRLLEAPCRRFEDAWKAGPAPCIEEFLGGAAGLHRAVLLKELVRLDIVYRRRRGEPVSSAEYLRRFPDLDAAWLERELMPATVTDPRAAGLGETLSVAKAPVAASQVASAPGDSIRVPGYEVLGELGRGGMGVVYLARNVVLDRREVLKVVNQKLLGDPAVAERFLREMRSAAKLSHDNVVKAYSAPQAGESLVFAMEYVEGQDLAKLVQREGPLPIAHACHYVSQAALGLQHAHEQGMVHRDIKPQNLILTRQGERHVIKILDFGLAKAVREGEAATDLTGAGVMMGTPAYMAPEQAQDAATADIRADVYSLGCTLYFLLTGAPPFAGASLYAILKAHESAEATPLHQKRPGVPAELSEVAARMMAKDPARRYQKPIDAANALAPIITPGSAPPPEPVKPPPPRTKGGKRRNIWRIVAAGGFLMLLVAGAALWVDGAVGVGPREKRSDPPPGGTTTPSDRTPASVRPSALDCTGEAGLSAVAVRQAQQAWARYLGRDVEEEDEIAPDVPMRFVLVPPGVFRMGSPEGETDRDKDEALQEVELRHPFYLGVYDVTQRQYEAATGKTPSNFKGPDLPVEQVSWEEADACAKFLTGKAKDGLLYRLPTEAEWEYSCRGGRSSSLPFGIGDGTSLSSSDANFDGNRPYGGAPRGPYLQRTTPVGTYRANALGLYDMHGNVWQWCSDWEGDSPPGRAVDPTGPAQGSTRVIRGGGWNSGAGDCRAACSDGDEPGVRDSNLGFRLVRVPPGLDK